MAPIVTSEGIDLSPGTLGPIVLVVAIVTVLAVLGRHWIFEAGDVLADLWRTYGPIAGRRTLDHRPGLAAGPWVCERCRSMNPVSAKRCYKCDAKREDAEAVIEAEAPVGPSAGLTQRTRTKG